jgi:hypothetical protein
MPCLVPAALIAQITGYIAARCRVAGKIHSRLPRQCVVALELRQLLQWKRSYLFNLTIPASLAQWIDARALVCFESHDQTKKAKSNILQRASPP